MADSDPTRRQYIAVVTALATPLAGCSSSNGAPEPTRESTTPRATRTETTTEATETTEERKTTQESNNGRSGGGRPPRPDYNGWLDSVAKADTVSAYGETEVTVTTEEGDGSYRFSPAAVQIDLGATVTWELATDVPHEIAAEDDSFHSELLESEGDTFQHTFTEPGIHRYTCLPHQALGEVGVVVAGTDYPTVLPDAPLSWYADTYDAFLMAGLANRTVYATTDDDLRAYDVADGSHQWTTSLDTLTTSHNQGITPTPDAVYVATGDATVRALDPATGEERWTYSTAADLETTPILNDETDTVYVAGQRGTVYALNTDSTRRWQTELESEYIAALTHTGDALYAGGGHSEPGGSVYRLDPSTGERRWRYETTDIGATFLKPVVVDDVVLACGARSGLHAINTADGTARWTAAGTTSAAWQPQVHDDTVYVRADDTTIEARDVPTGDTDWRATTDAHITRDPLPTASELYVPTGTGVVALDAAGGEATAQYDAPGPRYRTGAIQDRSVFLADWGVWALDLSQHGVDLPVTVDGVTVLGSWPDDVLVLTA